MTAASGSNGARTTHPGWYLSFLGGLCIFMFYVTLLFMDVALGGYMDPDGKTDGFRAAVPLTVFAPAVLGILLGHFFHPGNYGPDLLTWAGWVRLGSWGGFIVMAIIVGVLLILGMIFYFVEAIDFAFPAWSMLITGILLGAILWPVYRKADRRDGPFPEARENPDTLRKRKFWFEMILAIGWVLMMIGFVIAGLLDNIVWAVVAAAAFWMVFIIITDVFLAGGIEGDTWSEQIRNWSLTAPLGPALAWLFAVLAGRWFHPGSQTEVLDNDALGWVLTGIATAIVIALGLVFRYAVRDMRWIPPWAVVILGLVAGWIFTGIPFPPPP